MKALYGTFLLTFFMQFALIAAPASAQGLPDAVVAAPAPAPKTETADKNSTLPEDPIEIDKGTVREILKSDLILLDNDKRYKLDNVRIPPYEDAAALDDLTRELLNKEVIIYTYDTNKNINRYGVPLVHVMRKDGKWIQGHMISKGLAWVSSSDVNRRMMPPLRALEDEAREQGRGFWANQLYAIKTADNVHNYVNSFQIVEGKVLYTSLKQGIIFINFGKDWKTDFTIRIPKEIWDRLSYKSLKTHEDTDIWKSYHAWKNATVRVRGWVMEISGPAIELTQKDQIEFLSFTPPPK